MKAVPVQLLALGLALLIWGGALGPPVRAARQAVGTPTVVAEAECDRLGRLELRMNWHWPFSARPGQRQAELLLAVSFDTERLAFESEEATAGQGAGGENLNQLERIAGPDGARRLYVVREGEDGSVRVRFRPVWAGRVEPAKPFRLFLVTDPTSSAIQTAMIACPVESAQVLWSITGVDAEGMEKGEGRP
ncbi:MAG: hypothetical protein ACM3XM_01470 [Mycobacterium leprae]